MNISTTLDKSIAYYSDERQLHYSNGTPVPDSERAQIEIIRIEFGTTVLEDRCFEGCSRVTGIRIPDSVTCIGENAFNRMDSLTSLTIPQSVTEIERPICNSCKRLVNVVFNAMLPKNDRGSAGYFGDAPLENLVIGKDVENIPERAFCGLQFLTSVVFKDGRTSGLYIHQEAFNRCSKLYEIHFPDDTYLDLGAFGNCTSLKKLYVGKNFDTYADIWNESLVKEVHFRSLDDIFDARSTVFTFASFRSPDLYIGDELITEIVVPSSVSTLYSWTFCYNSLRKIVIPETVTTIECHAIYCLHNLEELVLPGDFTFKDTSDSGYAEEDSIFCLLGDCPLKSITLTGEVSRDVLEMCIAEGDEVREILSFQSCGIQYKGFTATKLLEPTEKLCFLSDITEIADKFAYRNIELKEVELPPSLRRIGVSAFEYCINLEKVLGTGISSHVSIEDRAFARCYALEKVDIASASVAEDSFAHCYSLPLESPFCQFEL